MYFYKDPTETKTFEVSFEDSLLSSEHIDHSHTTLSIYNIDTDGISTSDIYVASSLDSSNSVISFRLKNGSDNTVYKLTVSTGTVTSSGNVYTKVGYLYVTNLNLSLVTLEEIKDFLNITSSNTDTILLSLLNSANAFVKSYTGKCFEYKKYTETYYPEESSDRLKLNYYPAHSISSVIIDGITLDATTSGYANYVLEDEGFIRRLDGFRFTHGGCPIVVSYTAGYKPVPEDIKYAIKKLVASSFNTRLQEGISSETLGTYKITFANTGKDSGLDPKVKEILDKYTPKLI